MNTFNDPAFWLGLWGSLLATALAILQALGYLADRGRLKFRAHVQSIYHPSPPDATTTHQPGSEPQVIFTVTNVGRRKLRVMGFGVRPMWSWKHPTRHRPELHMYLDDFPFDLGEGDTFEFKGSLYEGQIRGPHVTAFVYDSLGHLWKLPRSVLRRVRVPALFKLPPEVLKRRPAIEPQ